MKNEQVVPNAGGVKQRVVRNEEQILSLIAEYESCPYTVKEFCDLMDVNEATFYSWLMKYRPMPEGKDSKGGFVTVELTHSYLFVKAAHVEVKRSVSQRTSVMSQCACDIRFAASDRNRHPIFDDLMWDKTILMGYNDMCSRQLIAGRCHYQSVGFSRD